MKDWEETHTHRGFEVVRFKDAYDTKCSIQISSACPVEEEDGSCKNPGGWIWLGQDEAKPRILMRDAVRLGIIKPAEGVEISGWVDYPVPDEVFIGTSMHLGQNEVLELIERLQTWAITGSLHYK